MTLSIIKWKLLRLFNLNNYFRNNITKLKYIGKVYLQHHTTHLTWYEKVAYVTFDKEADLYYVQKIINKQGIWVKKSLLYLNAR